VDAANTRRVRYLENAGRLLCRSPRHGHPLRARAENEKPTMSANELFVRFLVCCAICCPFASSAQAITPPANQRTVKPWAHQTHYLS